MSNGKFIISTVIVTFLLFISSNVLGEELKNIKVTASSVEQPDHQAENVIDGNMETRWSSEFSDPQWIMVDLGEKIEIQKVVLCWETAYAKAYRVEVSEDGKTWNEVYNTTDGDGSEDEICFEPKTARYVRMYGTERGTEFGYSLYEFEVGKESLEIRKGNSYLDPDLSIDERVNDLISQMTLPEKVDLLAGGTVLATKSNRRLRIPVMRVCDGPHGVGSGLRATCFPTGISLASTWDVGLIYKVGVALGCETRGHGRHMLLAPNINIHRTPLGGRNFESFGEDPYLTSRMAVAYIKGVQSQRIGTSTKHYACNNQEWERETISAEIDERTLREIYLPAFKAAVREAETTSVMAAHNKVNGDYNCANKYLLTDVLKKEWGFKGFVMSDWGGIHSTVESANAGLDIEMGGPGKYFNEKLLKAVKDGEVSEEIINDKVSRILRVFFWLGLFDDPDPEYKGAVDTPEHRQLTREAAANAIVLMKNKRSILPLTKNKIKSIAVIGPNAGIARLGGGGSSIVYPFYSISPLEAITRKCGKEIKIYYARGVGIEEIPTELFRTGNNEGLKGEYFDNKEFKGEPILTKIDKKLFFEWKMGSPDPKMPNDNFSIRWSGTFTPKKSRRYTFGLISDDGSRLFINNKLIIDNWSDHWEIEVRGSIYLKAGVPYDIRIEHYEAGGGAAMKFGWEIPRREFINEVKNADVAIVFAGISNYYEGEGIDRKTLKLPNEQIKLIRKVAKLNKNTIVVLNNGTPVLMGKWLGKVPAVVEAWYPGQEGGNAIADVLFGDVNPSGKIPSTFPKRYKDAASSNNYPGKNNKVYYKEGIFVGYRHFDKNGIKPLFPFGHGLSYTEFKYSNLEIISGKNISSYPIEISMDIENTGGREGKEVIQLYVRDIKSSIPRPVKELKAFKKVNLNPGEKKKVNFLLNQEALAFYDPSLKKWVVEPGEFEVLIGGSSRDIRLNNSFIFNPASNGGAVSADNLSNENDISVDLLTPVLVKKTNKQLIFVHYMPWFESTGFTGGWGRHWTMANCNPNLLNNGKRQIASHYYPLVGPYDSADPDLLEYHVLLMRLSGIDGVFIDWPGLVNLYDYEKLKENTESLVSYIEKAGLKFGIVYEDNSIKEALENKVIDNKVEAGKETMEYLENNFFASNYYIRIKDRPLLLIWGPRAILTNEEWEEIFTAFHGKKPYLVFLRGHTGYNNLYRVSDGEYSWLPREIVSSLTEFYETAREKRYKVTIGSVFQGYHDYYKEGDWGDSLNYIPHKNGQTFIDTLALSKKWKPDILQIPTWNDFGEGTIIEPTLEFGYKYLKYIQGFTGVQYDAEDLNLAAKIYFLRKQYKDNIEVQRILDEAFHLIISGKVNSAYSKLKNLKVNLCNKSEIDNKSETITSSDIGEIKASSEFPHNKAEFVFDKSIQTRWESHHNAEKTWIQFIFKKKFEISSIRISWEAASAKRYKIQVSNNEEDWQTISSINNGKGGEQRLISFGPVETKYLRIYCEEKTTQWGYSILEVMFNIKEESFIPYNPIDLINNPDLSIDGEVKELIKELSGEEF